MDIDLSEFGRITFLVNVDGYPWEIADMADEMRQRAGQITGRGADNLRSLADFFTTQVRDRDPVLSPTTATKGHHAANRHHRPV